MDKKGCPLCEMQVVNINDYIEKGLAIEVSCANCGQYTIHSDVLQILETSFQNQRYTLSGLIRENTEEHRPTLAITETLLRNLNSTIGIPADIFEQMDKVLMYIYNKTSYSGKAVILKETWPAIAYAKNIEEFKFLLSKLIELRYIENPEKDKYILSIEGWKRVSEIKKIIPKSNLCFVAMWFNESMDIFESGVRRALKKVGYEPMIIKDLEHNDKICDKIISEIRKSSLMIADFTGHRGNVYFEAGFAKGLEIPVIFTCRDSDFKDLQFDTRQYNHIEWSDSDDLCENLINRIQATVPVKR